MSQDVFTLGGETLFIFEDDGTGCKKVNGSFPNLVLETWIYEAFIYTLVVRLSPSTLRSGSLGLSVQLVGSHIKELIIILIKRYLLSSYYKKASEILDHLNVRSLVYRYPWTN